MQWSNERLLELLAAGNEHVFEQVFKSHFKNLHNYAFGLLKDEIQAEEMVQQVFFRLWEQKERLQVRTSLNAYLYRSVHNACMNYLAHRKVRAGHAAWAIRQGALLEQDAAGQVQQRELEGHIRKALDELPAQCRLVFELSRFGALKYQEIAQELDISVKTVENQMGKALRLLRAKLVEFLPFILFFFYW